MAVMTKEIQEKLLNFFVEKEKKRAKLLDTLTAIKSDLYKVS